MAKVKLIGLIVALALVCTIALQNTQQVETRLLFATVTMPGAVLLFVTAAIGFGAGVATSLIVSRKRRTKRDAAADKAE